MSALDRYDKPIAVAEGIYWVGFYDAGTNLHCNPYLVVEGDQAILIDGGSRPDFPTVMMKVLQVGIDPSQIVALIYQHYDPDLCGSMGNLVDIIGNPDLPIISHSSNRMFLSHYIEREQQRLLRTLGPLGHVFEFGGRTVRFVKTPYCHSAGSFVTFDPKTKTVFSSDLFGGFSVEWDLYLTLDDDCYTCRDYGDCPAGKEHCPIGNVLDLHRRIMPCDKALRRAMEEIRTLGAEIVAPQHGSILEGHKMIALVTDRLAALEGVGIDGID